MSGCFCYYCGVMANDMVSTYDRFFGMDQDMISRLYEGLQSRGIPEEEIPVVLSYILEESGGDPNRSDSFGRGLMDGLDYEDTWFIDDNDSLIDSQLDTISEAYRAGKINTGVGAENTMYGPMLQYGYGGRLFADGGWVIPDEDELARRQAWAESLFNTNARSQRGAMGVFQIMPNTLSEYQTATGDKGDIYDASYNRKVRDWLLGRLGQSRTIYNGNPSDAVRLSKLYAAYNWGQGNLGNYLQKQKDAGVDIYQSLDWVNGMPEETRNYVNFIVGGQDTGAHRTNDAYGKAAKTFADGGERSMLWDPNGVQSGLSEEYPLTPLQAEPIGPEVIDQGDGYDAELEGVFNDSITSNLRQQKIPLGRSRFVSRQTPSSVMPASDTSAFIQPITLSTAIPQSESVYVRGMGPDSLGSVIPQGDYKVLDRDANEWFVRKAAEANDSARLSSLQELSSMPREQLREVQQQLADSGAYASQLGNMSEEQIRGIQRKLVDSGFLSSRKNSDGSYYEVDGIVGRKTIDAWNRYNVDGRYGARTADAYSQQYNSSRGNRASWGTPFSAAGIDGCARWVTRKFESVMGNTSAQNGVVGNAWNMPMNIVAAGGQMLYNIYDSPAFDDVKDVDSLKRTTSSVLKSNPFDYSTLRQGDVVGIYYPGSKHHSDTLATGTTYNTHVGIVSGFDKDGMPMIEHNMGQHRKYDRADKIYGSGQVAVAVRPKGTNNVDEYSFRPGKSNYSFDKSIDNDKLRAFADSMAGGSQVIGSIYPNADMGDVQKIALAVLGRETGFMNNTVQDQIDRGDKSKTMANAEEFVKTRLFHEPEESKSSNLTKFKITALTPNERKFLGINSKDDLEDPAKAGLASMYYLAKNYDYFKRLQSTYPDIGLTDQDIRDLTALSYNQGMGRLYSIGFDSNGNLDPSEIESIRALAESDEKVDDISATKLGRVYKRAPGIAQTLYDLGVGTRSTSYVHAARVNAEKIHEK